MRLFHRGRRWLLLSMMACVLLPMLAACGGSSASTQSGTPLPTGLTGDVPQHLHYLDMTDTIQPDPSDAGKQLLAVTVHVHADEASQGVLAMTMFADPGTGPLWPHPGYPGGSPATAAQKVNVPAGDGQIDAKFPLRMRKDGKVQPDDYNIQSGGFYDVSIYGGGLPATTDVQPVAAFQTSRLYALPDFGGPPPTITPTPLPTVGPTPIPSVTVAPSPTPYPTIPPTATATPLPPPFEVGLLGVHAYDHLDGVVGVLTGIGGAALTPPAGQTYVVGLFVVRRDLPTVNDNPLPMELSLPNGGSWKPDNANITAKTGSLSVRVAPYGPISITYDPRNQVLYDRLLAAQVWTVPTAAAADLGALRFDGKPASAYPMSNVGWVDPGFPYHLKDNIGLSNGINVQVIAAEKVSSVPPTGTPVAGQPAPPPTPGVKLTLSINGDVQAPVTIRLRPILEDGLGLRAQVDCPVQTYPKLTLGQPQQLTCAVPLPLGGSGKDFHLGITGTSQGLAIPTQWVALGF